MYKHDTLTVLILINIIYIKNMQKGEFLPLQS